MEKELRVEERSGGRLSFKRYFLLFCLLALLLAGCFAAGQYALAPGKRTLPLKDWRYAAGSGVKQLAAADQEWMPFSDGEAVRRENGDSYILLQGALPASSYDTLCVRTQNNPVLVRVDGETVYDNLKTKKELVGQQVNVIELPASAEERQVEIVAYSPLAFTFSAYLTMRDAYPLWTSRLPLAGLLVGGALIAAGTAAALAVGLAGKRRLKKKKTGYVLTLLTLLSGMMFVLDPLTALLSGGRLAISFKTEMAFQIGIPALMLLAVFWERVTWNPVLEGIIGLNILYALVFLLWPHDILLVLLLRVNVVLQIVNAFLFFYLLIHDKAAMDALTAASATVFLAANLLYWRSWIAPSALGGVPLLVFGTFFFAAGAYTAVWREAIPQAEIRREKSPKRPDGLPAAEPEPESLPELQPVALKNERIERLPAAPLPVSGAGLVYTGIDVRLSMGELLLRMISDKCDGPYHHLLHVAEYVRILCFQMGFQTERAMTTADASLLHDIGKLCIPRSILMKTTALTDEEFQEIKRHHIYGYHMLSGSGEPFLELAARMAREHHEHINGTGYMGLHGEGICLEAKILSVADVFDALTSPRGYKKTWNFQQAFSYVQEHNEEYFDEQVIRAFVEARDDIEAVYQVFQEQIRRTAEDARNMAR